MISSLRPLRGQVVQVIEKTPGLFFGKIFQIRDIAHLTHLRQFSKSGWQHSALGILYDEILELADGLVESYQGIYGTIDIKIPESEATQDAISFVQSIYDTIQSDRYIFSESWIQNEIDNIAKLLAQTLFRLKFAQ